MKDVALQLKSIEKTGNLYCDKCLQKAISLIEWRLRGQLAVISRIGISHTFICTFTFASAFFRRSIPVRMTSSGVATQPISILSPRWQTIFMIASCCLHACTPVQLKVLRIVLSRSSSLWLGALWLLPVIPRFPLSRQAKTRRPDGQCPDQDLFTWPHFQSCSNTVIKGLIYEKVFSALNCSAQTLNAPCCSLFNPIKTANLKALSCYQVRFYGWFV